MLETLSDRTSLMDRSVENRLSTARDSEIGRICQLDRRVRERLMNGLDNHVVRIMLINWNVHMGRCTDLEGQSGMTSLGDSRVQNQRGDGVGSWMDGHSLWHSGHLLQSRINRPVNMSLLGLGDARLRKDIGKQLRQEHARHNDKRRVKLLVLVTDDIGIIVADDLGITVADDLGITVGVADATPNLVLAIITHSRPGDEIYRIAIVLLS
jgi:hypothetical protein